MSKEYLPSMKKGEVMVAGGRLWFFGRGKNVEDRPDIMLLDNFGLEDARKLRDILNNFMLEYIGVKK